MMQFLRYDTYKIRPWLRELTFGTCIYVTQQKSLVCYSIGLADHPESLLCAVENVHRNTMILVLAQCDMRILWSVSKY